MKSMLGLFIGADLEVSVPRSQKEVEVGTDHVDHYKPV